MGRNLNPAIESLMAFEGISDGDPSTVNLDPYLCPAGYWTIGYGHAITDASGKMLKGVEKRAQARAAYPDGISRQQAYDLLVIDTVNRSFALSDWLKQNHVELNNNQFCALLSLIFNVGFGAFKKSTLAKRLVEGRFEDVPVQLMRWTFVGGRKSAGLKRRREAEAALWMTNGTVLSRNALANLWLVTGG